MLSPRRTLSTAFLSPSPRILTASLLTCLMGLAACGSDKAAGGTNTGGGSTNTGDTTPGISVVNSDKTGTEPTTQPLSPEFKLTRNGADTAMPYLMLTSNANATNPNKANSLSANSYDTCVFSANHGYSTFPRGKFDFVGFYLINQTPGAALVPGTYTAGSNSGMYIDMVNSGAGYDLNGTTACKGSYALVASGTITITAVGTGRAGTTGTANVTMTDGSVFSGAFGTGTCVGGTGATPNPPANDPYACTKIN